MALSVVNTYKTIILPIVLYGCKTWSLILREEHRLRLFENKVFRKNLGIRDTKLQENGESYIKCWTTCIVFFAWHN